MASTRFAGSVFAIMILVLVFHAHEAYGGSVAKTAGRKALRDGKMEVFTKVESDGKKGLNEKPNISESYGSEKTPQETTAQVSAENASGEVVNLMNSADYSKDDQQPHGRRKPPINNNDPKH